jgi:hypothetical protein
LKPFPESTSFQSGFFEPVEWFENWAYANLVPTTTFVSHAGLDDPKLRSKYIEAIEKTGVKLVQSTLDGSSCRNFYTIHTENWLGNTSVVAPFNGVVQVGLEIFKATSSDPEIVDKLRKIHAKFHTKRSSTNSIYMLVQGSSGPRFTPVTKQNYKFRRDNYTKAVLADYDKIIQELESDAPAGRIHIVNGPPGTGKTHLIKGLISDTKNCVFVIVPSSHVGEISSPGYLRCLLDLMREDEVHGPPPALVFLIEEADQVLSTRANDNFSQISNMLNLGDGILGSLLNVKIIATTNAETEELDAAITRPGRLSVFSNVVPFTYEEALEVFDGLNKTENTLPVKPSYTLAEIYAIVNGTGTGISTKRKKMGF